MPERVNGKEKILDFEGMVPAEEVSTFRVCRRLQDVQRACKDGSKALLTTVVEMIEQGHEGIIIDRITAKRFKRKKDMEFNLAEIRAAKSTMREQLKTVNVTQQLKIKPLVNDDLTLTKMLNKSSLTDANLQAQMTALEKALSAERAHVEYFECKHVVETMQRQRLLAKSRETSPPGKRQLKDEQET